MIDHDGAHPLFLEAIALPHDGSSIMTTNGDQILYKNIDGELHREDGPAFISSYDIGWFINGVENRKDGPNVIYRDGSQFWIVDRKSHRCDGPAIIDNVGNLSWFIEGANISIEVEQWLAENNINYPFRLDDLVLFQMRWL